MSIQVRSEGREESWVLQPGQECFYCCKEITVVAIFWMGNGSDLWLHPECCQRLMLRLGRDCWELETRTGNITFSRFYDFENYRRDLEETGELSLDEVRSRYGL